MQPRRAFLPLFRPHPPQFRLHRRSARRGGARIGSRLARPFVTETSARIYDLINRAAQRTGVSAHYLQATAQRESSFDPAAKASTSSASGLFQFIERTWLDTFERHGDALGLDAPADGDRSSVLAMRFDPKAAALLAGALTRENAEILSAALDREPNSGELYAAHVLGAGDAVRLLKTAETTPQSSATEMFPRAAAANPGLFLDADGAPRTVAELRDRFAEMMDSPVGGPVGVPGAPAGRDAPAPPWSGPARAVTRPPLTLTAEVTAVLAGLPAPQGAEETQPGERRNRDDRRSDRA